jgi:enoyl-CoA hydratase/carnithine racemase
MPEAKALDAIVRYEVSEKVARITLARPPVNALSLDMIRAVVTAVKRAADEREARVVVLSNSIAKRFSAGLDLDTLLGKSGEEVRPTRLLWRTRSQRPVFRLP